MNQLDTSKNYVITIGRQFGSGGRELGHALAESLGIEFYDKQLLAEAAKSAGISHELFEKNDERMPSLLGSSVGFNMGYGQLPWYNGAAMMSDNIYNSLSTLISHLADTRPCVIVGRTADYVLRNHPTPHLNIFVHAPMADRVRRIMARTDIPTEAKARSLAVKNDKLRASYYNFYTDMRWGDAATYDLTLNSSLLPMADICHIIAEYIRCRFSIEPRRR